LINQIGQVTTLCGSQGAGYMNDFPAMYGGQFQNVHSIVWVPPFNGGVNAPGSLYVLDSFALRRIDLVHEEIVDELKRCPNNISNESDSSTSQTNSPSSNNSNGNQGGGGGGGVFDGWPHAMIELIVSYLPRIGRVTTLLISASYYGGTIDESNGISGQWIQPTSLCYWAAGDSLLVVDAMWPNDTVPDALIQRTKAVSRYQSDKWYTRPRHSCIRRLPLQSLRNIQASGRLLCEMVNPDYTDF
jgi:hypothetical protein